METTNKNAVITAMAKATKKGTFSGLKSTDVNTVLESLKPQIAQALPKASGLSPERVIQITTSLITKNPKIADCTASSLLGAVLQASILGFKPVESLGECYFVPYGNNVQFQIGYRGLINLARRSGNLETIYSYVVRSGDVFNYELGLNPILKHIPGSEEGEITHVYAVAKYKDGGFNFVVLTRSQIEALRKRNPMQGNKINGAWLTDYEAMAKAKAIKQLAKYMPLTDELATAIKADEAVIKTDAFSNNNTGLNPERFTYDLEEAEILNEEKVKEPKAKEPKETKQPEAIAPNETLFNNENN